MLIDDKTFLISETNRYKTHIAKTQIVLGTSLRKDNNHVLRLQHKDYGKTKRWNTYTISRTGDIFEHYSPKFHSDFLNIKDVDKKSVSIVIENMGCLFKTSEDKYINWLNEECQEENVVEKLWLGYNYWERIPDDQLISLVELCRQVCENFSIPKLLIDFPHFHKDIHKFKGIVFRSNYIEDTPDINPLFDIGKFNEMLHNEFI